MLRMYHLCFLLMFSLAFSCAVVASQEPTPTPTKWSNEQKTQTTSSHKKPAVVSDTAKKSAANITLPIAPNAEKKPTNQPEQTQEKSSAEWWLVGFNGLLVVVVFLQWFWMVRQEKVLKSSIAVAEKAASAARESADASIAGLMPVLSPLVIGGNLHPLEKISTPITFNAVVYFVFENYGKLPGAIRELRADLILNQMDEMPRVDFENLPIMEYAPIIPGESRGKDALMAAADFTKQIILGADIFNELLAEATGSTYRRFALVGRVVYDDFLGYRHTQRFCVKLRRMGDKSLFQLVWGGLPYNSISRKKIPESDQTPPTS